MSQGGLFADARGWPAGLAYEEAFLGVDEEEALLAQLRTLAFAAARYKVYVARRRVVSYGSRYDFGDNVLESAPPLPAFLLPLRARAAGWVDLAPESFGDALIAEYSPGTPLGWHRDVPDFEDEVGISLASACTMRFRPYPPPPGRSPLAFKVTLAPRSIYALRNDARWRWQHMVPPTPALRYSITFRTRRSRAMRAAPDV